MKCPYQTITIHKPEYVSEDGKHFAEDAVVFGDCIKKDCPYYYMKWANGPEEHCHRVESEDNK